MTKKEVIDALANIGDDDNVLIGINICNCYITKAMVYEAYDGEKQLILTNENLMNASLPLNRMTQSEFDDCCNRNFYQKVYEFKPSDED